MNFAASATLQAAPAPELIEDPAFVVRPEYIDPNDHMNVGYYSVLFDVALERFLGGHGLDTESLGRAGLDRFTAYSHVVYKRELLEGDHVRFDMQVRGLSGSALHLVMHMYNAREGWLAASCEQLLRCVRKGTEETRRWPDEGHRKLEALMEAHRALPMPQDAGRRIAIRDGHPPGVLSMPEAVKANPLGLPEDISAFLRDFDYSDFTVRPEYCDADGNIVAGFYVVLVDLIMRQLAGDVLGMGFTTMMRTGKTGFVAESHLAQMAKLHAGDPVRFEFKLLGLGEKVNHIMVTVRHARGGRVAAVLEQLNMCIDLATRRPSPFHPDVRARLEQTLAQQRDIPDPMPPGQAVALDA